MLLALYCPSTPLRQIYLCIVYFLKNIANFTAIKQIKKWYIKNLNLHDMVSKWRNVKRSLFLGWLFLGSLHNMAQIRAMDDTTQNQPPPLRPNNSVAILSDDATGLPIIPSIQVVLTDGLTLNLPANFNFDLAGLNIIFDRIVSITSAPITYLAHLTLNDWTKLTALSFPNLTHIIFFSLQNTGLKDLAGLPNLTVLVDFNLSNSCALENISGLNHIKHINKMYLKNNTKLKQITGLQSLASIGYLEISGIDHPEDIIILKEITATRLLLLYGYMRSLQPSRVWGDGVIQIIALYSRPYERLIDLARHCEDPCDS